MLDWMTSTVLDQRAFLDHLCSCGQRDPTLSRAGLTWLLQQRDWTPLEEAGVPLLLLKRAPDARSQPGLGCHRLEHILTFLWVPGVFCEAQMQRWPWVPHQKDTLALGASPEHKAVNSSMGPGHSASRLPAGLLSCSWPREWMV